MAKETRLITLTLKEADCSWLEERYGDDWISRLEQHIHGEINARKDRSGWYDEASRRTGKSAYKFV